MKKIMLSILVTIIASISLAQNNTSRLVKISAGSMALEENTLSLHVTGMMPNPCTILPRPTLTLISEDTLVIGFQAESKAEVCIALVGAPFNLVVKPTDIKNEVINLGLDSSATYNVVNEQGEFVATYKLSEIDIVKIFNHKPGKVFPGQFVKTNSSF